MTRIVVIPGLVPGIHPSVRSSACMSLDPGNKRRDDKSIYWSAS